jgi:hypothetical protein
MYQKTGAVVPDSCNSGQPIDLPKEVEALAAYGDNVRIDRSVLSSRTMWLIGPQWVVQVEC